MVVDKNEKQDTLLKVVMDSYFKGDIEFAIDCVVKSRSVLTDIELRDEMNQNGITYSNLLRTLVMGQNKISDAIVIKSLSLSYKDNLTAEQALKKAKHELIEKGFLKTYSSFK